MDRIAIMQIAVAVADAGSLSAAGRQLRKPLATVSRQVAELEKHLRTPLFVRTPRRVTLTAPGVAYIESARRILDEIAAAERTVAGEYSAPRGELVISAPLVLGRLYLVPAISAFLARYAEVTVHLELSDGLINLFETRVDLAVRIGHLADSNLVATRLGEVRRVCCAAPAYLQAHGTPADPEQLKQHHCITFEGTDTAQRWTFMQGRQEKAVKVQSMLTVNTAEAALDAAVAGVGITRALSYQAAVHLKSGRLARLLRPFEPPPLPVHFVRAPGRVLPQKVQAFLGHAAPQLRDQLLRHADSAP